MTNYCAIRTADEKKDWIWEEMQSGRLRQGWGLSGTQLPLEESSNQIEQWCGRYRRQAQLVWNEEISADSAERRFWILHTMTKIAPGDIIVVPKMPTWGSFCITKASARYQFKDRPEDRTDDDFRHIVPTDPNILRIFPHQSSVSAQVVSAGLRGYRSAVNTIQKIEVQNAIEQLLGTERDPSSGDISTLVRQMGDEFSKIAVERVVSGLTTLQPHIFQSVVRRIIEQAGYRIIAENHYDSAGGDADIVAEAVLPALAEVFEQRAVLVLQVKKKQGIDHDDVVGVQQLVNIATAYPGATLGLISSADDFTDKCKLFAAEKGVQLLSKHELGKMFLKYML